MVSACLMKCYAALRKTAELSCTHEEAVSQPLSLSKKWSRCGLRDEALSYPLDELTH